MTASSEEAVDALLEKYLLIRGQVFGVQRFHALHFVIPVQELVFALSHLVEGQELYTPQSDLMQKRCNSLCI